MGRPKKVVPPAEPKRRGRPPKAVSVASKDGGVPHTVVLPVDLACEIEMELAERTCQSMREKGNRSASSLSHWFREAVEIYLTHCAKLREAGKPIPGDARPPAARGIQTTLILDQALSLALAEEQFRRISDSIRISSTRATSNLSEWFRLAAGYYLETSRVKRVKAVKPPAATEQTAPEPAGE